MHDAAYIGRADSQYSSTRKVCEWTLRCRPLLFSLKRISLLNGQAKHALRCSGISYCKKKPPSKNFEGGSPGDVFTVVQAV